ncbi:major histocompatibility complex class I-related gene protein-like isoform X1 [Hemicordylus capensis]|uniref:major histocompatibility complex class I-related gene protein-like isoform X1 n=1 Tax=Hemicordylus capensis TaxID=884348 RepID=UPI0023021FEB|nr:major histocompatibility complex class I-related gene protein-like isoform X1 [Hemicordylus capensis]
MSGLLCGRLCLLLGSAAVAASVPRRGFSGASSSHSLRHFYLGVSEPIQGLPRFTQVGYVDDQLITRYDSNIRMDQPQVPWMGKVEEEDPQFWKRETHLARIADKDFEEAFVILQSRYEQNGGLHTWQCLVGCELSKDKKQKGRFMQCGYDGRDFISLDKETFTWTAADAEAQDTKRKWEADPDIAKIWGKYLEEECIERLQKYLYYGEETLLRTESPTVKVHRNGQEILVCRADGFYPKQINATWRKDGEVWKWNTSRRGVTPNSDGTYHTWISIKIDPKDRDHYKCHVEHDGLQEPLDLAWVEPASVLFGVNVGTILAFVVVAFIILLVLKIKYHKKCLGKIEIYSKVSKKWQQEASRGTWEAASSDRTPQKEEKSLLSHSHDLSDHLSSNYRETGQSVHKKKIHNPTRKHRKATGGITDTTVYGYIPAQRSAPSYYTFGEQEEGAEKEVLGRSFVPLSAPLHPSLSPSRPLLIVGGGERKPRHHARQRKNSSVL